MPEDGQPLKKQPTPAAQAAMWKNEIKQAEQSIEVCRKKRKELTENITAKLATVAELRAKLAEYDLEDTKGKLADLSSEATKAGADPSFQAALSRITNELNTLKAKLPTTEGKQPEEDEEDDDDVTMGKEEAETELAKAVDRLMAAAGPDGAEPMPPERAAKMREQFRAQLAGFYKEGATVKSKRQRCA